MWIRWMMGPALLTVETARMMADSQAVIAMRTAGMMGLWATAPGETDRMVSEKTTAAIKSAMAAQAAILSGAAPHEVLRAGLAPIRRKAGKNARRLAARGPRLPG